MSCQLTEIDAWMGMTINGRHAYGTIVYDHVVAQLSRRVRVWAPGFLIVA